ncbi:MAG: SAM-dependent methyltransferase [Gaiellaceae bacterium]
MAERAELEFTYSLIDRVFRISLGELADFSGAKYDGDFSLTLEEAQLRKHDYVAEQIGLAAECRVLDLGCGWGPLLDYSRSLGATGLGVTLSSAQVAACRAHDPARTPAAGLPVFSAEQFPEMLRECVQHAVALAG